MLKKSLLAIALTGMSVVSISAMQREMMREYQRPEELKWSWYENDREDIEAPFLIKTSDISGTVKPSSEHGSQFYHAEYVFPDNKEAWSLIAGKTKDGHIFARLEKFGRKDIHINNAQEVYDYLQARAAK